MPSSPSVSHWKPYFMTNKSLDISNGHLDKIKNTSILWTKFQKSFEEISKNDGISFLFLDPSETHLQHSKILLSP